MIYELNMYFVYMIKNERDKLYIGVSKNPEERLKTHNDSEGADFTKDSGTFKIVFIEQHPDLSSARQREIQLKKWNRQKKEFLIDKFNKGQSTKLN